MLITAFIFVMSGLERERKKEDERERENNETFPKVNDSIWYTMNLNPISYDVCFPVNGLSSIGPHHSYIYLGEKTWKLYFLLQLHYCDCFSILFSFLSVCFFVSASFLLFFFLPNCAWNKYSLPKSSTWRLPFVFHFPSLLHLVRFQTVSQIFLAYNKHSKHFCYSSLHWPLRNK